MKKAPPKKEGRAVTFAISLRPHQLEYARSRADVVGSVSRYFQAIIENDMKHNTLRSHLLEAADMP